MPSMASVNEGKASKVKIADEISPPITVRASGK